MQDLTGKVAVVTGAASGIGLGCARTFARAGMKVALCDLRADPLAAAVDNVRALGGEAIGIATDVSKKESVEQAAERVIREFGKIHIAMNNAGVVLRGLPMTDITDEGWNWVLGVNLYGVIHGIQSFVPRIRAHHEGGHVINTASMAGLHVGNRQTGAYAASKFAVVALSEALEKDLAGTNIGVSVLNQHLRQLGGPARHGRQPQSVCADAGRHRGRTCARRRRRARARRHSRRAILSDHASRHPRLGHRAASTPDGGL
jgi:NAD(P)-dependent dehydrogenase (short-subunit alcohol dehydrogenase family)